MRLLSLAPSNTEILFSLGVGDQLIGITNLCDYPKEKENIKKLGSWIFTEPKKITELKPDFIFTSIFIPESLKAWKGPGKIIHVEPKILAEVYQSIKYIGKVVQKQREAVQIVKSMQQDFSTIKQYSNKTIRSSPRIYAEEWPKPPMASGNWVPELISIAGGTSGLSEQGKPSSTFLFKNLEEFDPDLMLFHWCGADFWRAQRDKRSPASPAGRSPARSVPERRQAPIQSGQAWQWSKSVENRPGWKKLRAVRENKLFVIDDSLLNRPGPRLVEGVRRIKEVLLQI